MATANQNGKSFFELVPQEIRDQIYDATMLQDIRTKQLNFRFKAPCLHLRLVSRRFKDEYDERSIWGKNLEVSFRATSQSRHPKAPRLAARCTSIQLNCLFPKNPHGRERSLGSIAHMCYGLMLRLAPEGVRQLEVCLVWNSVRMLSEYASHSSYRFHHRINHLIQDPYSMIHIPALYETRATDISSSGIVAGLKLQYGGIPPLNTLLRSKCDVLGAGILKHPVTLGTWSVDDDCFLLDDDGISKRLRMETVVESATQAVSAKDHVSENLEIDISEDHIWQQEVDTEVSNKVKQQ